MMSIGNSSWVLYSDGGGQKTSGAAGACIIENQELGVFENRIIYLSNATNNEAEISAGLLGFAAILKHVEEGHSGLSLRWVCDSQYVLKSATGYINNWKRNGWKTASKGEVKNQGLWNVYLELSKGIKVIPEHVKGHAGHTQNEACDTACTWAISNAEDHFDISESGMVELSGMDGYDHWHVFDGREFIDEARDWQSAADTENPFSILMSVPKLEVSETPREKIPDVDLTEHLDALKDVAKGLGDSFREKALKQELRKVVRKYSK